MPTLRIHTHWQVAKSRPTSQNLPKSMAAPTLRQKGKIKHGHTTKCINHWAVSAGFKVITLNKLSSGLTGKCFEMPNASYTNR